MIRARQDIKAGWGVTMPAKVVSTENVEHYRWGGPQGSAAEAWYLVKTPELHVIEEWLPGGVAETRHSHARARQFFFVLAGELTMEVEDHEFRVLAGEGIEVAPGQQHQAANRGSDGLRLLVTSQPPSHGDRVDSPSIR